MYFFFNTSNILINGSDKIGIKNSHFLLHKQNKLLFFFLDVQHKHHHCTSLLQQIKKPLDVRWTASSSPQPPPVVAPIEILACTIMTKIPSGERDHSPSSDKSGSNVLHIFLLLSCSRNVKNTLGLCLPEGRKIMGQCRGKIISKPITCF